MSVINDVKPAPRHNGGKRSRSTHVPEPVLYGRLDQPQSQPKPIVRLTDEEKLQMEISRAHWRCMEEISKAMKHERDNVHAATYARALFFGGFTKEVTSCIKAMHPQTKSLVERKFATTAWFWRKKLNGYRLPGTRHQVVLEYYREAMERFPLH